MYSNFLIIFCGQNSFYVVEITKFKKDHTQCNCHSTGIHRELQFSDSRNCWLKLFVIWSNKFCSHEILKSWQHLNCNVVGKYFKLLNYNSLNHWNIELSHQIRVYSCSKNHWNEQFSITKITFILLSSRKISIQISRIVEDYTIFDDM